MASVASRGVSMVGSLLWACTVAVQAGEFVTEVGDELMIELSGGWSRFFPNRASDDWHLLFAAGGNFNLLPMTADYEVVDQDRLPLTPSTELKDHAIVHCANGGYLHTASANISSPNDSAYAYRYDEEFNLTGWTVLEEEITERSHNDMPLSCSPGLGVTVFGGMEADAMIHSRFFQVDDTAQVIGTHDNRGVPFTAGCTFRHIPENRHMWILQMSALPLDNPGELIIHRMDQNLQQVESLTAQLTPEGITGHWPQGLLRIGDYWMVAFIGWPDDGMWDGHNGDLWVSILDRNWDVLESIQISDNEPSNPGMRPGLVRRGNTVLASYDKQVQPHVIPLTLDLDEFGVEEGETGGYWDTGGGNDTGDAGGKDRTCGCTSRSGAAGAGAWWLLAAALRRRRPTPQA